MKIKIIFFCLITTFLQIYSMDILDSFSKKITNYFEASNHSQDFLIKTIENNYFKCNQSTIYLSALLTLAYQSGAFYTKEKALYLPISKKNFSLFTKASANQTATFFTTLTHQKLYDLLCVAYTLKAPMLYAYLIKNLLTCDIDKYIAPILSPLMNIKTLLIKKNISNIDYTHLIELPLRIKPKFSITFNHNQQMYIVKIKETTPTNDPFSYCALFDIKTKRFIKQWKNYDIVKCDPQHNNIALGSTYFNQSNPTLVLYNIDKQVETILELDTLSLLTFSPDGNYLAATHKNNNTISLWKTEFDKKIKTSLIKHNDTIDAITFNTQSTALVSGSHEQKNCIVLWDIENFPKISDVTLLTNQHRHFKKFIFNKAGNLILAQTEGPNSFLLSLDQNNCNFIQIKTPVYALFNPPYIPDQANFHSYNQRKINTPYKIIKEPTNQYSHAIISPNGLSSAAYNKTGLNLTFYSLTSNQKEPINVLLDHNEILNSLEFSDSLLLSACSNKIVLWDNEGSVIKIITPQLKQFRTATLTQTGQYLISLSFEQSIRSTFAQINSIQLYSDETQTELQKNESNLTTAQAITLRALYEQNKRNKKYFIPPNSFHSDTFNSFSNETKQLLQETLKNSGKSNNPEQYL